MSNSFQRLGARSNAQVGRDFENKAQLFFVKTGLSLKSNIKVDVGIELKKKSHAFDLGCLDRKIIVECKSHTWTSGGNVPSAKLTVWNEAMFYFYVSPKGFRKIMFVLRDYSEKRNLTLAEYYLKTYMHLIPSDVEFWEYNELESSAARLHIAEIHSPL